jgi:phage terminase small subunit
MKSKKAEHLLDSAPDGVVEIYESHRKNYMEAIRRVSEEGQVVRDMRGAVVAHPSLAIQHSSSDAMLAILHKYAARRDEQLGELTL